MSDRNATREEIRKRGFELMFRVYAPRKEFFDKAWVLPDVERIAQ